MTMRHDYAKEINKKNGFGKEPKSKKHLTCKNAEGQLR
jgi:hypothetical protein